jgi:predicted metal-dependent phosphoesterase TrpH
MLHRYDLHTHSNLSDGTDAPEEIVEAAGKDGLSLIAITDHDTLSGVKDAAAAGDRAGVLVIPGIEFNTQYTGELHILGFCIDIKNAGLLKAASFAKKAREKRNELIYEKLIRLGYDLSKVFRASRGTTTRLNFALALRDAGYTNSVREAFEILLAPGAPAYVATERIKPERAIEIIHEAGGTAVLAHPCKLQGDPEQLIDSLIQAGLDGLEVYYPRSTEEQTEWFLNIARQYNLLVTCGSDYHGKNRPSAALGCAWRDTPELDATYFHMIEKAGRGSALH